MLPKISAANSRGCGESRRSGKTAAGWESVQGTAKREASCHHQPTPPPGRKNPAIVRRGTETLSVSREAERLGSGESDAKAKRLTGRREAKESRCRVAEGSGRVSKVSWDPPYSSLFTQ